MQNFGASFTASLKGIKHIGWQRPIQSGYGWHVINISDIQEPQILSYESVKDQVAQDYNNNQRSIYNDKFYEALSREYKIQWRLQKWEAWIP